MTDGFPSLTTPLTGKVALVTGGAIRVGRVICMALASRGANIAFTYLPGEPAEEASAEIAAAAPAGVATSVLALPLDVREPGAPQQVVEQVIARFGRLDILVNNASVWLRAPFLDITRDAWQAALDINLTGPFLMSQAAAPQMLKQESGLIVSITDLSAYQTWTGYAHHAATKAGLVALDARHGRRACPACARQRHRTRHRAAPRRRRRSQSQLGRAELPPQTCRPPRRCRPHRVVPGG